MIADWRSYTVADFVPFTAEVYARLIEQANAAHWPLHLVTVTSALAALVLAWRGRARFANALLAVAWAWVGVTFLMQRYAELSWAGRYFGWAFLAQTALLLAAAVGGRGLGAPGRPFTAARVAGLAVAALGCGYPLIAPLAGRPWLQAETFGIHPDPTAIATLGVCLVGLRGGWLWSAMIVPGLWCLTAGLTLEVLGVPWAPALFGCAALAVLGPPVAAGTQARTHDGGGD